MMGEPVADPLVDCQLGALLGQHPELLGALAAQQLLQRHLEVVAEGQVAEVVEERRQPQPCSKSRAASRQLSSTLDAASMPWRRKSSRTPFSGSPGPKGASSLIASPIAAWTVVLVSSSAFVRLAARN